MVVRNKIVEMREKRKGLNPILKEVMRYEPFINLDELVNLSFILDTLSQNEYSVKEDEIERIVNKYYKQKFHGNKIHYFNFLRDKAKIGG